MNSNKKINSVVTTVLACAGILGVFMGVGYYSFDHFRPQLLTTVFSNVDKKLPYGVTPAEEYFSGGRGGTTFNHTSRTFEQPAPVLTATKDIEKAMIISQRFEDGEAFFETINVSDPDAPSSGLGPVYNKTTCISCHPNYGRARRTDSFSQDFGNGYIAMVHTEDNKLINTVKFMLQTMAVPPYKPPVDKVHITWNDYVDKYDNKYPDGTSYNAGKATEGTLTFPTATLEGVNVPLPEGYRVSLEATIGIFGTGLLDAIPDEAIVAEAKRQAASPGSVKGKTGAWVKEAHDGKKHLGRFTWHNTRATLQGGSGFNGIWSVSNLTREDRPQLFASQAWIDQQEALGLDTEPLTQKQPVEMTGEDMDVFMTWHRSLAVPAARNLDKPEVQRGKAVFNAIGCASCHKPNWTTGEYPLLPGYNNQKIWPYTDMLKHDMGKENRGFTTFFRTPPLWGRGMMRTAVDHTDMFHDLRARDFEEAILWHYGEAKEVREMFRQLPAEDRAAVIEFVKAI